MWPLPETLRSAGVEIEVLKVPKRALLKIPVEVPGRISFEAVTAVQAWQAGRSVVRIPLHPFGRTVEASGLRLSLSYVTAPQG